MKRIGERGRVPLKKQIARAGEEARFRPDTASGISPPGFLPRHLKGAEKLLAEENKVPERQGSSQDIAKHERSKKCHGTGRSTKLPLIRAQLPSFGSFRLHASQATGPAPNLPFPEVFVILLNDGEPVKHRLRPHRRDFGSHDNEHCQSLDT